MEEHFTVDPYVKVEEFLSSGGEKPFGIFTGAAADYIGLEATVKTTAL